MFSEIGQNLLVLDHQLFYLINHLPHGLVLDSLALLIHFLTYGGVVLVAVLLAYYLSKNKKNKLLGKVGLITIAILTVLIELIIKPWLQRPRPFIALPDVYLILPKPGGFSLPSSQSALAMAIALIFLLIYPKKWFSYIVLILAVLTVLGRAYMGHHYPSDVVLGSILGILMACLIFKLLIKKK